VSSIFDSLLAPAPGRRALEPKPSVERETDISAPIPHAVSDPMSKLDLPGTAADFAALAGGEARSLKPTPFPFKLASSRVSDAAGVATVPFGQPPIGFYWRIERIGVKGAGSATVYVGGVSDSNFMDFTTTASQDIADEASPIYVPSGQDFDVRFSGAGVGTLCTVTVQGTAEPTSGQ
jgi:hypothetical protein